MTFLNSVKTVFILLLPLCVCGGGSGVAGDETQSLTYTQQVLYH